MKQTSIKKMLALFLIAAVMLAAFTACAEKAPDTAQSQQPQATRGRSADDKAAETSTATPEEPVTINFWHHYSAQSAENDSDECADPKFEENLDYKSNAVCMSGPTCTTRSCQRKLEHPARCGASGHRVGSGVPENEHPCPLDQQMGDFNDVAGDFFPAPRAPPWSGQLLRAGTQHEHEDPVLQRRRARGGRDRSAQDDG